MYQPCLLVHGGLLSGVQLLRIRCVSLSLGMEGLQLRCLHSTSPTVTGEGNLI